MAANNSAAKCVHIFIARCDDGLTFIAFYILSNRIHTKNHIKFIDFDNRVNTDKAAIFLMVKISLKKSFLSKTFIIYALVNEKNVKVRARKTNSKKK